MMFNILSLNIVFNGNLFWLALIPAAAAGAFLVYHPSRFPLDRQARLLLRILRCMVMTLLILLLAQPILTMEQRKEERPTVTVLIDGSTSMQLVDPLDGQTNNRSRGMIVKEILGSRTMMDIKRHFDTRGIVFAVHPQSFSLDHLDHIDSLTFHGEGTDLATALRSAGKEPAAGIILLSDGADNAGSDVEGAATELDIPVFSVGIGGAERWRDTQVVGVDAEGMGVVGKELTVKARITDQGESGMRMTIQLKGENGEVLDRRDVTLLGSGKEQEIVFHTVPSGPAGLRRYTVEIPPIAGEASMLNNAASTVVPIFKGKHAVLLIGGQLGWEFAFLRRTLEVMDDLEVVSLVGRKGGGFLEGAFPDDLRSFSLIILLDVSPELLRGAIDEEITRWIRQGGALLCGSGSHTFGRGYRELRLAELLPVRPINRENTFRLDRFVLELTPAGQGHPVMRIGNDYGSGSVIWKDLPPFLGYNEVGGTQPGAVVLGTHPTVRSGEGNMPMLIFSQVGNGRVFLTLCFPFWRAEFLPWGSEGSGEPIRRFWRQAVRWLTAPDALHPVTVATDRPIYRSGTPVIFEARIMDEMFQPNDEADVLVRVMGGEEVREVYLTHAGRGYYRGKVPELRAGDYQFEGTASTAEKVIGKASGRFTVDRQSVEFQETRMNEYLMKKIAAKSGGKFYRPDEIKRLIDDLQPAKRASVVTRHIELRKNGWIWFTLLLLVSSEWMIRKRKGMV